MLLKRNILECSIIVSLGGTLICVLLNYLTSISPISGIWFPLYILTLFFMSVFVSVKFIKWLLSLNKPIKDDLEEIVAKYPYLSCLSGVLPKTRKVSKVAECREYDTNELSVISTVLERKLVSSWYVPYISQEIGFPFACKQMLDQIIGRSFQICNKIETKDIFVDVCIVLTSHLNEYKKAQKRQEKAPASTIQSLYKKSHPIFDVKNKQVDSADHCTNIIRIILKELIPWELWDTPNSELLVRILSKKLDNFIHSTFADPVWLNDKLMTILKGSEPVVEPEKVVEEVPLSEYVPEPLTAEELSAMVSQGTSVVIPSDIVEEKEECEIEKIEKIIEEVPINSTQPVDITKSPILRQRRGRQGRNEVKIYDRVIEGSVKTWETDIDLQCISMGQDLLASLDGEITLSRLWGQDADADGSPNPPRGKSPQPLWFGEEETIEVDPLDSSPNRDNKKEHSPKPADALLKDLQTTVSQAKHKIGDLQDEAAGMMEGLLDFGIAGLKKGLRFTGLSDDSQEKLHSHQRDKGDKSPPLEGTRVKPIQEHRATNVTNGQRDENNAPPLVKQQRVSSQDSIPSQSRPIPRGEASLPMVPDSPEPEYEEAADLSTSIAKLRCLLQQRAQTSPRVERAPDVWWESAEETRGRPLPHERHERHERPVDTATLADEYDMSLERNASPGQTSNNMQRLDKLFQRTVTGVFNSIKTAVGAEGEGPAPRPLHDWTYVCTSIELSVCGAVARLVGSRRGGSHVEAALDSLAELRPRQPLPPPPDPIDLEEWCGSGGACSSSAGAALAAAGLARSHLALSLATLLLADLAESFLDSWLEELGSWLRQQVFATFEQLAESDAAFFEPKPKLRDLDVDQTCAALLERIQPSMYIFGEERVTEAVRLVVSSFSHKDINVDVLFRTLDLLAGQFKKAAGLRNPSFDSN
ncbi:uncharacterized protein LOC113500095 isoform X2 [Trichoplusia ni]|uniref:Uncharacterized protein LOC113500095 isoform X2 n=1 Tax=Trichoplusia ni TaxID=7111 RepID=A0A7E5W7U4_TRINI|nr:uncharacterized protein LOC113500095 isoform X2 [Trichoplusia ni]